VLVIASSDFRKSLQFANCWFRVVRHLANEYLFIFEKIRFASQKLNFSNFVFLSKKSAKMTSNSLEVTKYCKNFLILFLFFLSSKFYNFYVILFLEYFLDEPAMVLRY
jgi:hypothetical protein